MGYEVFIISVILQAGCNEIEPSIVNVSWREEYEKEGENRNTKWENSRDRYGYTVLNIMKKQLLESGRNSAVQVAACIVCNWLLKTQNARNIVFFVDILAEVLKY